MYTPSGTVSTNVSYWSNAGPRVVTTVFPTEAVLYFLARTLSGEENVHRVLDYWLSGTVDGPVYRGLREELGSLHW